MLRGKKAESQRRFRAALALADYSPESEATSWSEQDRKFVAEQLVSANAEFQPLHRDGLRPIRAQLLRDLEWIFADAKATDAQRLSAANAVADYAASDIPKLSQLLMGHAEDPNDMSATYRQRMTDERVQRVADYIRGRLFGTEPIPQLDIGPAVLVPVGAT